MLKIPSTFAFWAGCTDRQSVSVCVSGGGGEKNAGVYGLEINTCVLFYDSRRVHVPFKRVRLITLNLIIFLDRSRYRTELILLYHAFKSPHLQ